MLKRLGATAGVAWAAPVLTSIRTPAFAQYPPGPVVCENAVLSGGANATDDVSVDDDLEVRLNGTPVFVDSDDVANNHPPTQLGPVRNGDQLRVIASNSLAHGGCRYLDPLYLHCPATGAVQVLDADGYPQDNCGAPPPGGEVFYDTTFTVSL
jgi:hypothetical protein